MADAAAGAVPLVNPNGPSFVHLHVHTTYSMLDGACRITDLVKRTKELGMGAIAMTDHGAMFGAIEFYNACKAEGVKPIVGMEAYIAPGSRKDRSTPGGHAGEAAFHLVLLAQNMVGYQNLLRLASIAYREGFYYKPRIDMEVLREFHQGLVATTACLGGSVPSALLKRDAKEARRLAEDYLKILGPERFFIEVQKQGIKEQDDVNPELVEIAKHLGCGIVGTNDVHFLNREDHYAHAVLTCISTGKKIAEEKRMMYPEDLYLKSPQEMHEALKAFPEAISNTLRIAQMCNLELDFSKRYAPVYKVPPESLKTDCPFPSAPLPVDQMKEDERYLRQLCEEGLEWRYGSRQVSPEIRQRLEKELTVIISKQFCSYFLIVWDFCNYARDNGIPVGARGSGVGTMVGYLLGLCNVDPIRYGLLFERFMDPNRSEMPDIDIDICQDGRQRVIEYVRNKYGHVAQIVSYSTLAAKAGCKDVARVLGMPLPDVDKLTKLIPATPGMTLKKALAEAPELKKLYDENEQARQVIDIARRLEGLCRNTGIHAAGVIIADQPIDNIVPLYKDKDNNILTQYEGPMSEKAGLLKMDFLGLKTLSVITRATDLVKQTRGQVIDIEKIDITDQKVFELFRRGQTKGIFQFESGGMQDLLMKMKPDRLEDLIAANALYRPGPMELIPSYCMRKHGQEQVPRVHPIMDKILEETYGIMCIHEDARIAMADGTEKPIRDVRMGDMVHSVDLSTRSIVARECHGCGPTRRGNGVKVILENGFAVTLTDDHQVLTYDGMKEAGTLNPGCDLVAVGCSMRQLVARQEPIAPWLGADEDVAYLLGSLVGDGCLTGSEIAIATGRQQDHERLCAWFAQRLPSLRVHPYFHGRSWYVSLSHPQLASEPGRGNRLTRLHLLLEQLGLKTSAARKRIPQVILRGLRSVRAAFMAGLLDADGCAAVQAKGVAVGFLTSISRELLEDVRRLCQLEAIPATIRRRRIQFWNIRALSEWLAPYLLVRQFQGQLPTGHTIGWVPRSEMLALVEQEGEKAFCLRTGVRQTGLRHDFPFVKTSTAKKSGIDVGDLRFMRIARIESVENQQFYGMSVADHHNLFANGIAVKNCYQEQVMQIFNQLGGVELATAYKLIKAISKKQVDFITKQKPTFIKGVVDKGVPEDNANSIFDHILKFGGYGFNKSHSSRYAFVAFQTGFLKAYYPAEFMSAVLTYEMGDTDKVVEYIEECRRLLMPDGSTGVKVLPPDVNESDKAFAPVFVEEGTRGKKNRRQVIRFGLMAVRGVGEKAVECIIAERNKRGPFKSIFEFCERVDSHTVARSTVEALIKCGAFASLGKRAQLLAVLEKAMDMAQQVAADKASGQMNMFAGEAAAVAPAAPPALPNVDELSNQDLLKFEKELLGFYISSHPLTDNQEIIDRYTSHTTRDILSAPGGTEVTFGAMITRVKNVMTKNGRSAGMPMAMVTFEDIDGQIDGVLFAETFAEVKAEHPGLVEQESIVFVKGRVDRKRETPTIVVSEMFPVSQGLERLTTGIAIHLDGSRHGPDVLSHLKPILAGQHGAAMVYIQISLPDSKKVTLRLGRDFFIRPDLKIVDALEHLVGHSAIKLAGPGSQRLKQRTQQAQQPQLFQPAEPAEKPLSAEEQLAADTEKDD